MTLAFIENNSITKYPIGLVDIRRKFPNTSFTLPLEDQDLVEFGVVKINSIPQPSFEYETQKLQEGTPVLEEGAWIQKWNIIQLSNEETQRIEANKVTQIREDRNNRLSESDWTQLPDASVDTAAWATYRQALRDLPTQEGFPLNITWPTKP